MAIRINGQQIKLLNSLPAEDEDEIEFDVSEFVLRGDARQAALTAADGSTVDGTYGAEEAAVINNLVTRVAELETALQNLGLLS